jgi:hypothetical protein
MNKAETTQWFSDQRDHLSKPSAQGKGEARTGMRALLGRYGMQELPGQWKSAELVFAAKPFGKDILGGYMPGSGAMELRTEVGNKLKDAVGKSTRGASLDYSEADALVTFVHEEIHGMGGIRGGYIQAGKLIEEVVTETTARRITHDLLGNQPVFEAHPVRLPRRTSSGWLPLNHRPYDAYLAGVLEDIEATTGWQADRVSAAMEAAAFAMKASMTPAPNIAATVAKFVEGVPDLTPPQKIDLGLKLLKRGLTVKP